MWSSGRSQGLYAVSPTPGREYLSLPEIFCLTEVAAGPGFRLYLLPRPQQGGLLETCCVGCLLPAHSPQDGFVLQHTHSWAGMEEALQAGKQQHTDTFLFLSYSSLWHSLVLLYPPKPRSRRAHVVLRGKWAKNIQLFAGVAPFSVCLIPPSSPSPFL